MFGKVLCFFGKHDYQFHLHLSTGWWRNRCKRCKASVYGSASKPKHPSYYPASHFKLFVKGVIQSIRGLIKRNKSYTKNF